MEVELENAKTNIDLPAINELLRMNDRMAWTNGLLADHKVLSPLMDYLSESTLQSVRLKSFQYVANEEGIELEIKGEARGYSSLVRQAEIFKEKDYLKEQLFSDLSLNEVGNVSFSFQAVVNPEVVSYGRLVEKSTAVGKSSAAGGATSTASTTATVRPQATSTTP